MSTPRKICPTQRDIARRLRLDPSTVNKILRNTPGPSFNRHTMEKVRATAESMGYDLGRLRHGHRRSDPRRSGRLEVDLIIYDRLGIETERGGAVLVEISRSGARLDRVRLPNGFVPLDGPGIGIRPRGETTFELRGRLSRVFSSPGGQGLGVQFPTPVPAAVLDSIRGFRA